MRELTRNDAIRNFLKSSENKPQFDTSKKGITNSAVVAAAMIKDVPKLPEVVRMKSFRETVLSKCQKSFGINEEFEKMVSKLKKDIEAVNEANKAPIVEALEAVKTKEKRRVIGTIRYSF